MPKQEMMTTREFAEAIGRHYLTVLSWLREGLIPGAEATQETSGTVYKIPRSAVAKFKNKSPRLRGRGRPRKKSTEKAPKTNS